MSIDINMIFGYVFFGYCVVMAVTALCFLLQWAWEFKEIAISIIAFFMFCGVVGYAVTIVPELL